MSQVREIEVVGMERDDRRAMDRIRQLRPDVILVDSDTRESLSCLTISEIFQEIPDARVISLNLERNGIDIYDKQQIAASGPEDLVRAIRGNSAVQSAKCEVRGEKA